MCALSTLYRPVLHAVLAIDIQSFWYHVWIHPTGVLLKKQQIKNLLIALCLFNWLFYI